MSPLYRPCRSFSTGRSADLNTALRSGGFTPLGTHRTLDFRRPGIPADSADAEIVSATVRLAPTATCLDLNDAPDAGMPMDARVTFCLFALRTMRAACGCRLSGNDRENQGSCI
jgi:hypothetical protein